MILQRDVGCRRETAIRVRHSIADCTGSGPSAVLQRALATLMPQYSYFRISISFCRVREVKKKVQSLASQTCRKLCSSVLLFFFSSSPSITILFSYLFEKGKKKSDSAVCFLHVFDFSPDMTLKCRCSAIAYHAEHGSRQLAVRCCSDCQCSAWLVTAQLYIS